VAVGGLLAAAGLAAWTGAQGLLGGGASSLPPIEPIAAHIVVVRPGDTLWSIALASGDRGDIRPLVDRLQAETGGAPLQVGQHLLVP
jgi:hypothetical protein